MWTLLQRKGGKFDYLNSEKDGWTEKENLVLEADELIKTYISRNIPNYCVEALWREGGCSSEWHCLEFYFFPNLIQRESLISF